jgi:hypothetical protein
MDRVTNSMKKISKLTLVPVLIASLSTPLVALAQTGINQGPLASYASGIINIINGVLVPTLMAVAFIVFLYGVYKYFILGADDEKSRTEGRQFVLWGIIGFVVILSVWGLVAIVRNTFGLTTGNNPTPPTFNVKK